MKKVVFLFFIVLSYSVYGQSDFENFAKEISKEGISVYYKSQDGLPAVQYSGLEQGRDTLDQLQELVVNTGFGFMQYSPKHYVLLPNSLLDESNTKQFIQNSIAAKNTVVESQSIVIGDPNQINVGSTSTISGKITELETGEPVIGATILLEPGSFGSSTDVDGNYTIQAPPGEYVIRSQYIGLEAETKKVQIFSSGTLDFQLAPESITLKEIIVSERRAEQEFESDQVGLETISVDQIQSTSTVLGEADVVKAVITQAGVSTVGDGAGGFNVRGGNVDENLILQDEVIIFNSSHALGFYSIFNQDFISSVDLYKGNMPPIFGGRTASTMQVSLSERPVEKFKVKGGVGPIASRAMLEIPVTKNGGLLVGGRLSYGNYVLRLIDNEEVKNSKAGFYDFNAIYNQRLSDKVRLKLSHYQSHDDFQYNNSFGFDYNTIGSQADLKYNFTENVISTTSVVYSDYKSSQSDLEAFYPYEVQSKINYLKAKETISYIGKENDARIDGGFAYLRTTVSPGTSVALEGDEPSTGFEAETVPDNHGLELSAFIQGNYEVLDRIGLTGGIRFTNYSFLGPFTEYQYAGEIPDSEEIVGTTEYGSGKRIASYSGLDPRLSLRIGINDQFSIKGGYSRVHQFIHQIFNSDTPTPISVWQLSNNYVKPKYSDNFSAGLFSLWNDANIEVNLEAFYRTTKNLYDYRDFADLVLNPHLETEILSGDGRARGIEFTAKRNYGDFTGNITYTYSKSERQIDGVNKGEWYLSNFDKTNDLLLVLEYHPNIRSRFTVNYVYSTGRPITAPVGTYLLTTGHFVTVYDKRNGVRIPDYHRLDLAYNIGRSYKKEPKVKTSWTFAIYNVLGIKNPYSVFYDRGAFGLPQANKLVILGSALPSVSFNFEF